MSTDEQALLLNLDVEVFARRVSELIEGADVNGRYVTYKGVHFEMWAVLPDSYSSQGHESMVHSAVSTSMFLMRLYELAEQQDPTIWSRPSRDRFFVWTVVARGAVMKVLIDYGAFEWTKR